MLTTEMSPIIAAAQAGDTIVVRHAGGRPTTYKIRSVGGKKARELKLEGRRGSMRVLVDGGDQIWIREASARASDGAAHRRVTSLHIIGLDVRDPKTCAPEPFIESAPDLEWPPGYAVAALGDRFVAVLDQPKRPVVSPCTRVHGAEAVVDAWTDYAAKLKTLAHDRWDCIVVHAQAEARVLDRLPPGYTIEPGDPGFHRAVFDESGWVGAVRESESEAVVDAWTHAHDRLLGTLSKHRTTAIDRDVAWGDASRCRRALQQIREIAKGTEPTGKELRSGEMPEQVVAEVGHALRVESKGRSLSRSAAWLPQATDLLAWAAAAGAGAADKDATP